MRTLTAVTRLVGWTAGVVGLFVAAGIVGLAGGLTLLGFVLGVT